MSALADDWEDSDNDDWEAVADDLDNVNIKDASTNVDGNSNADLKDGENEVNTMTADEIMAQLKEKLVINSHNLCRGIGVATGIKLRTTASDKEKKIIFLTETLKVLGPHLKYDDIEAIKKITSAKVKVFKAQKRAEEERKKKEEETKRLKENPPAKKKKKKKKKKKRVYSVYEDEDDPDLWDGLDESSEQYHEALTHKSSRNFGKGDW